MQVGVWHTLFLTDLQHMRHLCSSCNVPLASLGTTARLTLLAEEMAELEKRNEELAKDNAALDTENEKYWGMYGTSPAHGGRWVMGDVLSGLPSTEEVDGLRHKIEELEGRLEVNHSVMPEWQCVCVCVCLCVHACMHF